MLKIRLARHGRRNRPFYRIVITENSKATKSGYQKVIGWFDPINHKQEIDIEEIKKYISNGAQISERVAKLSYNQSKDEMFKKFYEEKEITRQKKKEDK